MLASLLMADRDVPALRAMVESWSGESLRRFLIIFTCTRSLKSRELRKYVGFRRFILIASAKVEIQPGRPYTALAITETVLAKILSPQAQPARDRQVPALREMSATEASAAASSFAQKCTESRGNEDLVGGLCNAGAALCSTPI